MLFQLVTPEWCRFFTMCFKPVAARPSTILSVNFYRGSPVTMTLSIIVCKANERGSSKGRKLGSPSTLCDLTMAAGHCHQPSLPSVAELQASSRPVMHPRWPSIWPSPLWEHLLITRLGCWLELLWAPRSSLPMLTALGRIKQSQSRAWGAPSNEEAAVGRWLVVRCSCQRTSRGSSSQKSTNNMAGSRWLSVVNMLSTGCGPGLFWPSHSQLLTTCLSVYVWTQLEIWKSKEGKVARCCSRNVLTGWSLNLNQGICNHRTTRDRNRNDWPPSAGLVIWMELCGVEGKTSRMRVPKNASIAPQRAKISEKIEVIIEMHLLAEAASCRRGCT